MEPDPRLPSRAWLGVALMFIGLGLTFMAMKLDDANTLRIRLFFWTSAFITILGCIAVLWYGGRRRR